MVLLYMVTWIPSIYPMGLAYIYQHHGSYGLYYIIPSYIWYSINITYNIIYPVIYDIIFKKIKIK